MVQSLPEKPTIKMPQHTRADRYDPKVISDAYNQFLNTDANIDTIAIEMGVPKGDIVYWARRDDWVKRKEEITRTLEAGGEQQYREFLAAQRGPTAKRHLDVATELEEMILEDIRGLRDMPPGKDRSQAIRRLSESLASSSGVSARAAGISDRPAAVGSGNEAGGGKMPLIMIGVQPQASAAPGIKVINVEDYIEEGA
jgi:hypothetical protein